MSLAKTNRENSTAASRPWEKTPSAACISFHLRKGDVFVLPYSQILWISGTFTAEKDLVIVRTGHQEIQLRGRDLKELARVLSDFQVGIIRECSERSARTADGLIESCSIEPLNI